MKKIAMMIMALIFIFAQPAFLAEEPPKTAPVAQDKFSKEEIFNELELFADALTLVKTNYVENPKPKDMIYGALDGMLSSLDPHSSFLKPDDYQDIKEEVTGEFGGVGLRVGVKDKALVVISPLEDTPAYKAGVLPGDKIVAINDEITDGVKLDDAVKKLRGIPGTKVKITILREGEEKVREFELRRAIIRIKSIKNPLILKNGIAYIRIAEFQRNTAVDLDKAVKKLYKEGAKGLILDLRNNPGGLLPSSVAVSEKFLERGKLIVTIKGRTQKEEVYKSMAFKPYLDIKMAVLINQGSASASEIVAGALKDNKRAILVGETSFGKGSVQTVIPIKDGSALRLTVSYYYTPSGAVIHDKGIVPDIEVKQKYPKDDEDAEIAKQKKPAKMRLLEDNQVLAALDALGKQKTDDRSQRSEVRGQKSEVR